jgi:hypothetical protein
MSALQSKIEHLASEFANGVLEAIRGSSLEELSSGERKSTKPIAKTGRLARRSDEDIEKVIGRIVTLLRGKPNGLRAEQIREELDLDAKELPRPLADALYSKRISKSGKKRATTYRVAGQKKKAKKK